MRACHATDETGEERFNPRENAALANALAEARASMVPENYVRRVIDLARQGYTAIEFPEFSTDWNSDSYSTVAGQNSNNSVRVNNDFMRAVQADERWNLTSRTTGEVARTVRAQQLWREMGFASWSSADPGLQFDTTINEWHTCPRGGRINGSNPCVTGDTLVATRDGWVRIDRLVDAPTEVVGSDGALHPIEPAFVTGEKENLPPAHRGRLRAPADRGSPGRHPEPGRRAGGRADPRRRARPRHGHVRRGLLRR